MPREFYPEHYSFKPLNVARGARTAQVSMPTREPSFAAKKFMADMFAMPSARNGCNGASVPLLFRAALPAPRPWEERAAVPPAEGRMQSLAQHMDSLDEQGHANGSHQNALG